MYRIILIIFVFLGLPSAQIPGADQLPLDCQTSDAGHFKKVVLVDSIHQPMELAIAYDGRIFYTERVTGRVWIFHPVTQQKTLAAEFDEYAYLDIGLTSVALHPNFVHNNWVFIWHSPKFDKNGIEINKRGSEPANNGYTEITSQNANPVDADYEKLYILERFTLKTDNTFDMNTRKEILRVPFERNGHASMSMRFGPDGLLYTAIGDNSCASGNQQYSPLNWSTDKWATFCDAARSTGNSNDLRGKTLRLKIIDFPDSETPQPEVGGTYSIPPGNLFEDKIKFPDRTKVREEIYTMGHRNIFRLQFDPKTGWLVFGENGPAAGLAQANTLQADEIPDNNSNKRGPSGKDEYNVATQATNFGYPYFNGNNQPYRPWDYSRDAPAGDFFDQSGPVNLSPRNNGLQTLPPVKAAVAAYGRNVTDRYPIQSSGFSVHACTPLGGPVYRYHNYYDIHGSDSQQPSKIKWPPYYDGKWIIFGDDPRKALLVTLDSNASTFSSVQEFPFDFGYLKPLDMELGPDGALYVLDFGSGNDLSNDNASIFRVEYNGPPGGVNQCYMNIPNPEYIPHYPVSVAGKKLTENKGQLAMMYSGQEKIYLKRGEQLTFYNLKGEILQHVVANETGFISLEAEFNQGLYIINKDIP